MKKYFSVIAAIGLLVGQFALAGDSRVLSSDDATVGTVAKTPSEVEKATILNLSLGVAKNAGLIAVMCSSDGTILVSNALLDSLPFNIEKAGDKLADGMDESQGYNPNEPKIQGASRGGAWNAIMGLGRAGYLYGKSMGQRRQFTTEENQELNGIARLIREPYISTMVTAQVISNENRSCQKAVREIRAEIQELATRYLRSGFALPSITLGSIAAKKAVGAIQYLND